MKKWLTLLLFLAVMPVMAQSTPTPTPLLDKWVAAKVPWDLWFKNNALFSDKGDYVHIFWNANDFKANFEVKDKETHLAEAAVYLAKNLLPATSKSDLIKVDIVYVLERDSYGLPKWDSLQQVVHIEFSRAKVLKAKKLPDFTVTAPAKVFDKFQLF
jgi:hypothetical protein